MTEVLCNNERVNDRIIPQLSEPRPFPHGPIHLLGRDSVLMPATKGCGGMILSSCILMRYNPVIRSESIACSSLFLGRGVRAR